MTRPMQLFEGPKLGRVAPSSLEVTRRMKSVRQRNNSSEVRLRSMLHQMGLRFRLHRRIIPGRTSTADLVFPRARVAVFIDGCFWHSCPEHKTLPKANGAWWRQKLRANVVRDRKSDQMLLELGWQVIRIWEHEDVDRAANRILNAVLKMSRRRKGSCL
jgi:DNA mismatch endonuclease (patch repair protein)